MRFLGALALMLSVSVAEAETRARPMISFLGVRPADDSVKSADVESCQLRVLQALKLTKNVRVQVPAELDERAGGRVARTSVMDSVRPGDQLNGPAMVELFGDRVVLVTLGASAKAPVKADVYGTADGTLYLTVHATLERLPEVVREIDERLAPRPVKTVDSADLVKLTREAPETAAPDWPVRLEVRVDPPKDVSLTVYVRPEGEASFEPLSSSAVVEDAPGYFSVYLHPSRSGTLSYYLVALGPNTEDNDNIVCVDGNNEAPNRLRVDDRDTVIVDLTAPKPKESVQKARLAALPPPSPNQLPPGATAPQPAQSHPAIAIASFSAGAVAAALGVFFTVRTINAAADRRTCYTTTSCDAKNAALYTNQTLAWSLYGAAAVGGGVGGLALALRW